MTMMWTVWPARTNPFRTCVAVSAILFVFFCGCHTLPVIGAALATFVMAMSLDSFFLPSSCILTEEGAVISVFIFRSRAVKWEDVRRVYIDKEGMKLSTLDHRTRLEAFSGMYLPFGEEDPEKIKDFVRKHAGLSQHRPE